MSRPVLLLLLVLLVVPLVLLLQVVPLVLLLLQVVPLVLLLLLPAALHARSSVGVLGDGTLNSSDGQFVCCLLFVFLLFVDGAGLVCVWRVGSGVLQPRADGGCLPLRRRSGRFRREPPRLGGKNKNT